MFIELNEEDGGINTDRIEWMSLVKMWGESESDDEYYFAYDLLGSISRKNAWFTTKAEAEAKRKEIADAMNGKMI